MMLRLNGLIAFAAALVYLGLSNPASAYDVVVDAKVSSIEVTYVPGDIRVSINVAAGSCPAGTSLTWIPQGSTQTAKYYNADAILATLLTARAANITIRLYVANAGCQIEFLYIL